MPVSNRSARRTRMFLYADRKSASAMTGRWPAALRRSTASMASTILVSRIEASSLLTVELREGRPSSAWEWWVITLHFSSMSNSPFCTATPRAAITECTVAFIARPYLQSHHHEHRSDQVLVFPMWGIWLAPTQTLTRKMRGPFSGGRVGRVLEEGRQRCGAAGLLGGGPAAAQVEDVSHLPRVVHAFGEEQRGGSVRRHILRHEALPAVRAARRMLGLAGGVGGRCRHPGQVYKRGGGKVGPTVGWVGQLVAASMVVTGGVAEPPPRPLDCVGGLLAVARRDVDGGREPGSATGSERATATQVIDSVYGCLAPMNGAWSRKKPASPSPITLAFGETAATRAATWSRLR